MSTFFDGRNFFSHVGPAERLLARLDQRGTQWVLCVCVLVRFHFEVAAQGTREWTEKEAEDWVDSFITSAESCWSHKWSLQRFIQDTEDLYQKPWIVEVELFVEEFDEAKLPKLKNNLYDVFVTRGKDVERYGGVTFRTLGQIQVAEEHKNIAPSFGGKGLLQRRTDHEIGHALGLDHPNCEGKDLWCYGDPSEPAGQDIIGLGSLVSSKDYQAFVTIMKQIEGSNCIVVREPFDATPRSAHWTSIPKIKPGSHYTGGIAGKPKPARHHRRHKR